MAVIDPEPASEPQRLSTRVTPRAALDGVQRGRLQARRDVANIGLWTLQGWLAMFYLGAGYALATQPVYHLTLLLRWPALVDPRVVRGVGGLDMILGLAVLAPLVSWRAGLPILNGALSIMLAGQLVAAIFHGQAGRLGLTLINVGLIVISLPVLWVRRQGVVNPAAGRTGQNVRDGAATASHPER